MCSAVTSPNPPLQSASSHHYQGSIDFNTVNSNCRIGMYFLIPWIIGLMMREWPSVHCLESGHLSRLRKSLGRCTTQYIPPLGNVQYFCRKRCVLTMTDHIVENGGGLGKMVLKEVAIDHLATSHHFQANTRTQLK